MGTSKAGGVAGWKWGLVQPGSCAGSHLWWMEECCLPGTSVEVKSDISYGKNESQN